MKNILSSENLITSFLVFILAVFTFTQLRIPIKDRWLINIFLISVLVVSFWFSKKSFKDYFSLKAESFFWIFVLLLILGVINASSKVRALEYFFHIFLTAVSLHFVFKNGVNYKNAKKILYALAFIAGISAGIGILECVFKRNILYEKLVLDRTYFVYLKLRRLMSSLTHPLVAGAYFLTCLPITWFTFKEQKKLFFKLIFGIIFFMVFLAMFWTFSRGSWISFVFLLTIISIFKKKTKLAIAGWVFIIIVLITATISNRTFWFNGQLYKFINFNFHKSFYRFSIPYLVYGFFHGHRTLAYVVTTRMILTYPFYGVGWQDFRPEYLYFSPKWQKHGNRIPESVYLLLLAEGGLLVFSSFILFIFNLIKKAIKTLSILVFEKKLIFEAIFFGFIGLLLNMNFLEAFGEGATLYFFWIFTGLISALTETKNIEDNYQPLKV